jgi:predicted ribonuclease YlaK
MLTFPVILDSMPRKRSANPVQFGMSNKQMQRKKPINLDLLKDIEPLTENQEKFFHDYNLEQNMFAYGAAGTGKTFIALYLALKDVLNERTPYEKIYIVRSLVATREIGFLPGDHEDKSSLYQIPYKNMVKYMFKMPDDNAFELLYTNLKTQGTISFWSTSFIRGTTFDNAILLIDECQNLNFHELDSIITRVGENTKIMFCGDVVQSDLVKQHERNGIVDFLRIIENMKEFSTVEFGVDDIVRSGLVKSYLVSKINLGL